MKITPYKTYTHIYEWCARKSMRGFIQEIELEGLARRLIDSDGEHLLVVRANIADNGSLAEGKYLVAELFGYSDKRKEVSLTNPTDIVTCERSNSQGLVPFAAVEAVYLVSPRASQSDLRVYFEQRRALQAAAAEEEPAALSA